MRTIVALIANLKLARLTTSSVIQKQAYHDLKHSKERLKQTSKGKTSTSLH